MPSPRVAILDRSPRATLRARTSMLATSSAILDYGFRWLVPSPERTFRALDLGRRCAGGA